MPYNPYLTEETFFVATKCCLIQDKKVLVIRETRPGKALWWELPGGKISKVDRDIAPIESLARELREELGSDYGILEGDLQLFMVHKSYEEVTFSDDLVPFLFLCYRYEIGRDTPISLSDEHSEYRWISIDEIDTLENWREGFDQIVRNSLAE